MRACQSIIILVVGTCVVFSLLSNSSAVERELSQKISPGLLQLIDCKNPAEVAKKIGILIVDNSVKVMIVTKADISDEILSRYAMKKIKRRKFFIEAVVRIEDLIPLSREKEVKYIRPPFKLWRWGSAR